MSHLIWFLMKISCILLSFLLLTISNLCVGFSIFGTMIQTDKFTDDLNYVTIFFQGEINVGIGHVKFTDLVIVKYLHLIQCLSYRNSLSHNAFNIFSILGNYCLEVLTGYILVYLYIILKYEYVLTTDE